MKNLISIITVLCLVTSAFALTGPEVLKKVDEVTIAESRIITSTMIVHGRRASRTIESKSWIKGMESSFTEYLSPAREKGTKMLKLEDNLWTYSPQTDRTIRIAGHMLRQSVMGSDLSYEDMMEDPKLFNLYDAEIISAETIKDKQCYVLNLTAKSADVAYHSRKLWVDKERFLILKEERYAKSGKLLKTTTIQDTAFMDGRWVATKILFKDVLQNGKGTEFILHDVQHNTAIPDHIFSKASLRK